LTASVASVPPAPSTTAPQPHFAGGCPGQVSPISPRGARQGGDRPHPGATISEPIGPEFMAPSARGYAAAETAGPAICRTEGPVAPTSLGVNGRTGSVTVDDPDTPLLCRSPPGGCLRSDDRGVANLGHHPRHHVVEIVAVKRPAAGIVCIKGDGDAAHWRQQDGIAHGTC
jgi:hypothetical protein